jgi:hypothetical protein
MLNYFVPNIISIIFQDMKKFKKKLKQNKKQIDQQFIH